jgi:hypothetical protein
VLAGPGIDIDVLVLLPPVRFYGYIFLSKLNGISEVADASIG